ncbi:MAG TPA: hypothetical protein VM791_16245 [Vicinamibacterales bacterium]|nr:hypothetical protein [Vicinamibacterales bacterium]
MSRTAATIAEIRAAATVIAFIRTNAWKFTNGWRDAPFGRDYQVKPDPMRKPSMLSGS